MGQISNNQVKLREMETTAKEVKEILEKREGFTRRLKTIFDYHYDQILREIQMECERLGSTQPEEALKVMEHIKGYMDEMVYPTDASQEQFISDLTEIPY